MYYPWSIEPLNLRARAIIIYCTLKVILINNVIMCGTNICKIIWTIGPYEQLMHSILVQTLCMCTLNLRIPMLYSMYNIWIDKRAIWKVWWGHWDCFIPSNWSHAKTDNPIQLHYFLWGSVLLHVNILDIVTVLMGKSLRTYSW